MVFSDAFYESIDGGNWFTNKLGENREKPLDLEFDDFYFQDDNDLYGVLAHEKHDNRWAFRKSEAARARSCGDRISIAFDSNRLMQWTPVTERGHRSQIAFQHCSLLLITITNWALKTVFE